MVRLTHHYSPTRLTSVYQVIGAHIVHYLLEKSRVISPGSEERNYHVFYRICRGAPPAMQQALGITSDCSKFRYLENSQLGAIKRLDDKADFTEMEEAMTKCGLDQQEKSNVFRIVAAVLHIGNLEIEDAGDGSTISDSCASTLTTLCKLLGLKEADFKAAMCFKTMSVAGTDTKKGLDSRSAKFNREGLGKSLYSKLFDWIIDKANTCFPFPQDRSINFIGILDIAGFEYFKHNSFEQFCINYCNEKLQQFFNERTLRDEQELYIKEAINFNEVEFVDNHDVVDLIETPKTGILSILDEIAKMPRASDKQFCEKLHATYTKHFRIQLPRKSKMADYSKMRDDEGFIIRHFAGAVGYESSGFLDKNNDALTADLSFLMDESADPFLVSIFKPKPGDPRPKKGKLTLISLGDKFKKALATLMEKLNSCRASFVRCIKPNANQAPREFNPPMILAQLQCAGMVSVLELMQGGFPSRAMFQDLYDM
jgi:myosin-6